MATRTVIGAFCLALMLTGCSTPAPAPSITRSGPPVGTPTPLRPPDTAIWPLTGLPAAAGAHTGRPALMVKVDNVGGAVPQAGLNSADLVVEEPVEGGLTRLVAVFHSRDPEAVGPIRSARPIDADLSRMLGGGGILAFSGASPYEIAPVKAQSGAALVADDWGDAPEAFYRDEQRAREHDLFARPVGLRDWVSVPTHGPAPALEFSTDVPRGAAGAQRADLRFAATQVGWMWSDGQWHRTQNGRAHETVDGGRVTADTVIIMSVATTIDPSLHDVLGNATPVVQMQGMGRAWVMRDGSAVAGTWTRAAMDSPLRILDATGHPLGAKPGRTWLEVLPQPAEPRMS